MTPNHTLEQVAEVIARTVLNHPEVRRELARRQTLADLAGRIARLEEDGMRFMTNTNRSPR